MRFYTSVDRIGKYIVYRGYDASGRQFFDKEEYHPTIYVPTHNSTSKFKTLNGIDVEPLVPGNMNETHEYIKRYKDVKNFSYYGMTNWVYNFIAHRFPGLLDYEFSHLRIGKLDIETTISAAGFPDVEEAAEEIWCLTLSYRGVYHIFTNEKFGKYVAHNENVQVHAYPDERQMLLHFVAFWESLKLDVVTGWNSEGFDIPFLINRIRRVLSDEHVNRLSPWKKVVPREYNLSAKKVIKTYDILGVNHVDMLDAYKKFGGKQQESYKLDNVANDELGSGKLQFEGTLHTIYLTDYQKACEYNIRDAELLDLLDEKKGLLSLVVNLALMMKVNLSDTFRQTRMWDQHIHTSLLEENVVIPADREEGGGKEGFEGAYVKTPIAGLYKWVVSVDGTSLYPHIIITNNMSPETLRGKDFIHPENLMDGDQNRIQYIKSRQNNWAVAGNGSYYDRSFEGILPRLMKAMFKKRKEYKTQMLELKRELESKRKELTPEQVKHFEKEISKFSVLEKTVKVCLNSAYGTIGSDGFRYFTRDIAEGITLSGQLILRWGERRVNAYLNRILKTNNYPYVLYMDTDSMYLNLETLANVYISKNLDATDHQIADFLDSFVEKKLQPELDVIFKDLADYTNAYEQKISFKRESIIKTQIQVAKKKYLYDIIDKEGVRYDEPELGVTGVEIVRSSTPEFCRARLKVAAKLLLANDKDKLLAYINKTKEEFYNLPIEGIATPRGVSDVTGYTERNGLPSKGTPIQARAAILYNFHRKEKGIEMQYPPIGNGDKIKYTYLKVPNPIFENVVGFPDKLPKEFELEKYVDYETQWEKMFMSPVMIICNAIGMSLEEKNTLDDFFN